MFLSRDKGHLFTNPKSSSSHFPDIEKLKEAQNIAHRTHRELKFSHSYAKNNTLTSEDEEEMLIEVFEHLRA